MQKLKTPIQTTCKDNGRVSTHQWWLPWKSKKIKKQGKIGQFLDYNPLIPPTKHQRSIYIWLFVNYLMKDSSFDPKD
jgi:hypothetical protein